MLFKNDDPPEAGLRKFSSRTCYLEQSRQLVLLSDTISMSSMGQFRIGLVDGRTGPESILVAVAHGDDTENERAATFPDAILR